MTEFALATSTLHGSVRGRPSSLNDLRVSVSRWKSSTLGDFTNISALNNGTTSVLPLSWLLSIKGPIGLTGSDMTYVLRKGLGRGRRGGGISIKRPPEGGSELGGVIKGLGGNCGVGFVRVVIWDEVELPEVSSSISLVARETMLDLEACL